MEGATFRYYGDLNDFLPRQKRQRTFSQATFEGDQTAKHLIESHGIPHTEVGLILVDGHAVTFDHRVQPGQRVAVYPPFLTLQIDSGISLRPPVPQPARFLLDNHLGRLARYLRLLGFDALYFNNQLDDAQLATLACHEDRILLTRDRGLLKRSQVVHGYCLRTVYSREQLLAVIRRFSLAGQVNPWSRCLRCNGRLRPVSKADVVERLEPKTKRYFSDFRQCLSCQQVYWRGSHFARLQGIVQAVRDQFPPTT
jgi:uncharacterized protein with PIN domain